MDVRRLEEAGIGQAAQVAARAFFADPLFAACFPDEEQRGRRLTGFMALWLRAALRYGRVDTCADGAGLSLWMPPGKPHLSTWEYLRVGGLQGLAALGWRTALAQMRIEEAQARAHAELLTQPHWYLWGLAADPDRQRQGIASALLGAGLAQADAQSLPCYLETYAAGNLAFYEKRGFRVAREVHLASSGLRLWCLLREPQA